MIDEGGVELVVEETFDIQFGRRHVLRIDSGVRKEISLREPSKIGPREGIAGDEHAGTLVDQHVMVVGVPGDVDGLEATDSVTVAVAVIRVVLRPEVRLFGDVRFDAVSVDDGVEPPT